MEKKSAEENKSIYRRLREEAGMTREEASEAMGYVSDSRIEKYESGKSSVQPEEILAMAKDRFVEITADGQITEDELADFVRIEEGIKNIGLAADSLSLWMENTIAAGKIDPAKLEKARKALSRQ